MFELVQVGLGKLYTQESKSYTQLHPMSCCFPSASPQCWPANSIYDGGLHHSATVVFTFSITPTHTSTMTWISKLLGALRAPKTTRASPPPPEAVEETPRRRVAFAETPTTRTIEARQPGHLMKMGIETALRSFDDSGSGGDDDAGCGIIDAVFVLNTGELFTSSRMMPPPEPLTLPPSSDRRIHLASIGLTRHFFQNNVLRFWSATSALGRPPGIKRSLRGALGRHANISDFVKLEFHCHVLSSRHGVYSERSMSWQCAEALRLLNLYFSKLGRHHKTFNVHIELLDSRQRSFDGELASFNRKVRQHRYRFYLAMREIELVFVIGHFEAATEVDQVAADLRELHPLLCRMVAQLAANNNIRLDRMPSVGVIDQVGQWVVLE